jgi:hypothetical protein
MSEKLPAPDFDSQHYERPNQKWICGHAAEGKACRLGPDRRGRCQATFECSPALEKKPGETKGRWRCTRPGGACETGPLPDGTCCRPIPKCSPVPTLRKQRGRFTFAVVTATLALLLILLGSRSLRPGFLNSGELSTAHSGVAFIERNARTNHTDHACAACHQAGGSGASGLVAAALKATPGPFEISKLATAIPGKMTAIDEACQRCHTKHRFHQPNTVKEVSCSFCHAEHRGTGPMTSPTDVHCAFCHGNAGLMAAAAEKGAHLPPEVFRSTGVHAPNAFAIPRPIKGYTETIHRFADDHPRFRVQDEKLRDPNTLKFGHALHLKGETIPNLPNGQKLDCAFCHQPDAAGIYYRRINFENHCRVCHSLQFDPATPGLTLPHGDPASVSSFLHSLSRQYTDFAARSGVTGADEQRALVERKLGDLQAQVVSGEDFEKRVFFSTATIGPRAQVGSVSGATRALYPGCAYCHEVKSTSPGAVEVTKPILIERWLLHGEFDHGKHSGLACSRCHQAEKSKATADIILPTKFSCATCHSPGGGAPDSCVTCHVYHTERRRVQDSSRLNQDGNDQVGKSR